MDKSNQQYVLAISRNEGTMPEALTGTPPAEIRSAIFGFIRNEMSQAAYHAFRFHIFENHATVTTNPKYTDHNSRATLHLYGSCIHMYSSSNKTLIVEYAEPDLFDRIERFINCLVL